MNIVCIGAGRLAHHLMPALQHAGCNILQVYNRTPWPAILLSQKLNASSHITNLREVVRDADLYCLALSDDAIQEVARQLEAIHDIQGIGIHCSGVLSMDILPFDRRAVFYPLQTFSEHHEVEWSHTPIIITSEQEEISNRLQELARKISNEVYLMSDKQRSVVHLSAVFANNFTNHMLSLAEKICDENKVPFSILKPLIQTTIQKAMDLGPQESQTGPAIRGDELTIEKHIDLLKSHPEMIDVYRTITISIMNN